MDGQGLTCGPFPHVPGTEQIAGADGLDYSRWFAGRTAERQFALASPRR